MAQANLHDDANERQNCRTGGAAYGTGTREIVAEIDNLPSARSGKTAAIRVVPSAKAGNPIDRNSSRDQSLDQSLKLSDITGERTPVQLVLPSNLSYLTNDNGYLYSNSGGLEGTLLDSVDRCAIAWRDIILKSGRHAHLSGRCKHE